MKRVAFVIPIALGFAACDKHSPPVPPAALFAVKPPVSMQALNRGARLYQEHCASCHGPEAQGHPDWQNPKVVAAPPLNGTGNEWKRRKQDMIAVIKNGAKRGGIPVMPGWNGRLSDREIEDIIIWYQALWPADVYDRWLKVDAQASSPKS